MNYEANIQHLQDLAAFSGWVSLLVVPAVAAAKRHVPTLKGWKTLATSATIGCLVPGALVSPQSLSATFDCLLVGLMAAIIASGGDSYITRLIGKAKLPPAPRQEPPSVERPTVPSSAPAFPAEAPTNPEIKLRKDERDGDV
jgi:hypothetical protein